MNRFDDSPHTMERQIRSLRIAQMFYTISGLVLFSAVALILTFIVWFTYPYQTVSLKNGVFHVEPTQIMIGSNINQVTLSGEYCKEIDGLPVEVKRTLIGEYTQPTLPNSQTQIFNTDTGCGFITDVVTIPKVLNTGKYFVRSEYTFKVNPVRDKKVTIDSQAFEILPSQTIQAPAH